MPESITSQPVSLAQENIDALNAFLTQMNTVVVGKEHVISLAACCLLAEGHLLIEDIPGVGKTTLAQSLARSAGLDYSRIQFTSDMLPADILGLSIYSRKRESFDFHPGPIFSELVLADEVNRATPKTQSALLEAMAENQVSIEGETRQLPRPFFVIATQNPVDLAGTFPLPDSQLDRFLMRLSMGYPAREAERDLLQNPDRSSIMNNLSAVMTRDQMSALQQQARSVKTTDALIDYILALVNASRNHSAVRTGMSPRSSLALLSCTRAWAVMQGRNYAIPEDVQAVFSSVATHRINLISGSEISAEQLTHELVREVPIP